jgi:hypothetical protein
MRSNHIIPLLLWYEGLTQKGSVGANSTFHYSQEDVQSFHWTYCMENCGMDAKIQRRKPDATTITPSACHYEVTKIYQCYL